MIILTKVGVFFSLPIVEDFLCFEASKSNLPMGVVFFPPFKEDKSMLYNLSWKCSPFLSACLTTVPIKADLQNSLYPAGMETTE